MWQMLQQPEPDDFVVATGKSYSVRQFLEEAFEYAGLDWKNHIEVDPRYLRPTEVQSLEGNASKARVKLGWAPRIGFHELVHIMVDHDLQLARAERTLRDAGHGAQTSSGM